VYRGAHKGENTHTVYSCVYTRVHVHAQKHTRTHTLAHTHTYIYTNTHTHAHTHTYIYTNTHTYIYTNTHTEELRSSSVCVLLTYEKFGEVRRRSWDVCYSEQRKQRFPPASPSAEPSIRQKGTFNTYFLSLSISRDHLESEEEYRVTVTLSL
jgi:hypothetical protein